MAKTNHMDVYELFLWLVRLGIGTGTVNGSRFTVLGSVDLEALKALADEQGLAAVVLDGLNLLNSQPTTVYQLSTLNPQLKLEWIGEVLQGESVYAVQHKAAVEMAQLFQANTIKTYVLKGEVVAECYPKPNHRFSSDMDCFLINDNLNDSNNKWISHEEAWKLGNSLIAEKGYKVETIHYKNSTFYLPGLMVENHQFLTPFRGNKRLKALEKLFQGWMREDEGNDMIEGTGLYRPPLMVSTLFLIEHAYSHFLHEGLTWRHVLDWVMFKRKHQSEIDWGALNRYVDEFGFRSFFDSFEHLGGYLLGEVPDVELSQLDRMMLADIWSPLDLHPDGVRDFKGKLNLAGNTWRARWKYRHFTDMNWIQALWIQVRGFLFEKNPTLD